MRLKKILPIILLLTITITSYCQDLEDSLKLTNMEAVKLSLPTASPLHKDSLPFSSVTVLDERYDTSCFGITNKQKKITSARPFSDEVEYYIKSNYTFGSTENSRYKLVILLEKFWVTPFLEIGTKKKQPFVSMHKDLFGNIHAQKVEDANTMGNAIIIKAEILVSAANEYHPFYQVNKYYILPQYIEWPELGGIIGQSIDSMLCKVINRNKDDLNYSKTALSREDIDTFVAARFSSPIVNSNKYVRGIYMNFDEFKNNSPSLTDFSAEPNKDLTSFYAKPRNAPSYLVHDFFGYSDGINIYIMAGNTPHQLFKQGNTFIFWGYTKPIIIYRNNWKNVVAGIALFGLEGQSILSGSSIKTIQLRLQLDMETGESY